MNRVKKIITQPFILFVVFGILLFFIYTQTLQFVKDKNKKIVVSNNQIEMMKETFEKTWNRPPTGEELEGQIENYVMDEIFLNEAVAMGLDKSDPAVKRRLRQVIEMMMDDYTTTFPTEQQLKEYLDANSDKFRKDPRTSFRQVYFEVNQHNEAVDLLKKLQKGAKPESFKLKKLLMLPEEFQSATKFEVEKKIGKQFANAVFAMDIGEWAGPIASAYGWHLVKVSERLEGEVPELNEIWDIVEREWAAEQKKVRKEEQYEILRDNYKVFIEGNKDVNKKEMKLSSEKSL